MDLDLDMARRCLQASKDAYNSADIASALAHVLIHESGLQGNNNVTIVAFRGTANIRDWITDGECWMQNDPERDERAGTGNGAIRTSEVHVGFLRAMVSVFDPLLEFLKTRDGAPVVITGHSLGGALAMLCAKALAGKAKVEERPNPIEAVYTFGQPRVGNGEFARNYDAALGERTWRFVNEEDIVPRVPGLIAGYRHAGQEAFLPSIGGGIKLNPPLWFKAISDLIGAYRDWKRGKIAMLVDHHVNAYQARLGMMRPQEMEVERQ